MSETRQIASVYIGAYHFRIVKKHIAEYEAEYILYREWSEYTPSGRKVHKSIDCKATDYAHLLHILGHMQDYYANYCRVPTIHEVSV